MRLYRVKLSAGWRLLVYSDNPAVSTEGFYGIAVGDFCKDKAFSRDRMARSKPFPKFAQPANAGCILSTVLVMHRLQLRCDSRPCDTPATLIRTIKVARGDGVSRHVFRLETHIYTSLSWLSLDAFMSCLGSSLVAPCLVLALSHDCLCCVYS